MNAQDWAINGDVYRALRHDELERLAAVWHMPTDVLAIESARIDRIGPYEAAMHALLLRRKASAA